MAGFSETYDVTVYVHRETETEHQDRGALLVSQSNDKDEAVWIPKSQIDGVLKTGKAGVWTLTLPEWLVAQHDFD